MMNTITENVLLNNMTRHFVHPPTQLNAQHEADAELLRLPGEANNFIAITTDTIVEEFVTGLYDDPYLAGWMIVMANLSDLAAVGAEPMGLVLSETLPGNCSDRFIEGLQNGVADACRRCGTYILGGDTNFSDRLVLAATAIGYQKGKFITRVGHHPGDILYTSGLLGSGNGFALWKHLHLGGNYPFTPVARTKEGQLIAIFASACMDTSDGVFATLDQLMRLNKTGFELVENWRNILRPDAVAVAGACSIPDWLLFAGNHGEYELLFTVPQDRENKFLLAAGTIDWSPIRLGRVIPEPRITIHLSYGRRNVDTGYIRNLFSVVPFDIDICIKQLLDYDKMLRMEE
jgi:thiamine-monophosphate kinase